MPPSSPNPDLSNLALKLLSSPPKTHPTSRRVRILFNGVYVADTCSPAENNASPPSVSSDSVAKFVWEHPYYPYYYLPWNAFPVRPAQIDNHQANDKTTKEKDVDENIKWTLLKEVRPEPPTDDTTPANPPPPHARIWQLTISSKRTTRILEFCHGPLANHVRFEFPAADQWYEEDMPIMVHPKDPFKRIDTLTSLRPVSISVALASSAGEERHVQVAHSPIAIHLYETSLPTRYYIPFSTIEQGVLRRSEMRSLCPYKGEAEYYDVVLRGEDGQEEVFKDLVWYYRAPLMECAAIAGMACFYNEKVRVEVGGVTEALDGTSPFA